MISSKLPQIASGDILVDIQEKAHVGKTINLSDGFSGFSTSNRLISLVAKYMRRGFNYYAPANGIINLREHIAEKTESLYGYAYNPENEITITAGATQAISTAITAFIKEGDEVIVFEPAYNGYLPAIEVNGGKPVFVEMKQPGFHINWGDVQKVITSKTRMIIINSPHYSTGSVFSKQDMKQLQKIIRGTNIMLLSDEVYEHIIFDGLEHESVARYPELASRSLVICSFGTTYHISGWKIGYCLGPSSFMKEFRKVHQLMVHTVNAPIQHALAEFITEKKEYLKLSGFFQAKRDYFQKLLNDTQFIPLRVAGGYFQLVDYSRISTTKDVDFAMGLLNDFGVSGVPLSVFYHGKKINRILRFCFARPEETLEQAAEVLRKI